MSGMFSNCTSLSKLDISSFRTDALIRAYGMFYGCKNLKELDISSWDMKSVEKNKNNIYLHANKDVEIEIKKIEVHNNNFTFSDTFFLNEKEISPIYNIFYGCNSLKSIRTPKNNSYKCSLPSGNYFKTKDGELTKELPAGRKDSVYLERTDIKANKTVIPFMGKEIDLDWNDKLFSGGSVNNYNNTLAAAGLALSAESEDAGLSSSRVQTVLIKLGFNDIKAYNFNRKDNKTPAYVIANKNITVNGKKKALIVVTIRGTTTIGDKISSDVFDGMLNGFNSAGEAIYKDVEKYINKYCGKKDVSDCVFFINGHSLGGAAAASLNQFLCKKYPIKNIYAYTYASPKNSLINGAKNEYGNLYEIMNKYDYVPKCGSSKGGHYGKAKEFYGNSKVLLERYYKLLKGSGAKLPTKKETKLSEIGDQHDVELYMSYIFSNADEVYYEQYAPGVNMRIFIR